MLGLAGIPAVIQFVAFLGMPESPRWLASKGNYQEAMVVLRKFRGATADIEQEFEAMKSSSLDHQTEQGSTVLAQVLCNRSLRLALIVGCTLMVVQQVAGINTVMYYGATIIQMSGVHEESQAIWLSAATTFVNFACSFIAMALVERLGRRMLVLVSLIGVIVSLAVLATGFQLAEMHSPLVTSSEQPGPCSNYSTCAQCVHSPSCGFCYSAYNPNGTCLQVDPNNMQRSLVGTCAAHNSTAVWGYDWCPSKQWWMTILGLVMYLFFFAPGLGAMPWTINSEIYPLWARSTCFSIATSVCWAFNLLVSMTFLTLTEALTKYGTFWLYGGLSTMGLAFFFLFLPETKGKSLEEVEDLFAHPWWSDTTIHPNKKTVQYVHIRGINHAYTTDEADSGEETS